MQFNRRHGLSSTKLNSSSSLTGTPIQNNDEVVTQSPPPPRRQVQRSTSPILRATTYSKASKIPLPKSAKEICPFQKLVYPAMISMDRPSMGNRVESKPPKPPLPSTALHSRPPTRLSSKNAWAAAVDSNNNLIEGGRPISPLTRGNQSSSFQYAGPHQVYSGPIGKQKKDGSKPSAHHAEGPETLHYSPSAIPSGTSSTASQQYHRNLCEQISGFPLATRRKSRHRSRASNNLCDHCKRVTKSDEDVRPLTNHSESPVPPVPCLNNHNCSEPCAFKAFVEKSKTELAAAAAKANDPFQTQTSSSKSASTIPVGGVHPQQQQQSTAANNCHRSSPSLPPRGPFPSGVPSEIHDDLIRIEMLMELRKFKQALHTQIQAQERMLHMVDGCTKASLPQISQNCTSGQPLDQYQYLYPFVGLQNTGMDQPDPFQIYNVNVEGPQNLDNVGGDGAGNSSSENKVDLERPVTRWENDLAKHLESCDFYAPILEHHSQSLINNNDNSKGERGISGGGPDAKATQQVPLGENAYLINQAILDMQQNQSPRVSSLLKGTVSPDGFHKAPSVYPSELMNGLHNMPQRQQQSQYNPQNPLLAGAGGRNLQVPNYEHNDNTMPGENYSRKTFVPLDPIPAPLSFQRQNYDEMQAPQQQQRGSPHGSPFQQYQQFLLNKNPFFNTHHNIPNPNLLPQQHQDQMHFWDGQMIMLRKPVAISKNRSPMNYFSGSPHTPQSTSTTFGSSNEDRPSPFFPGVSGTRIDMKIRSPEERMSRRRIEEVNPTDVEKLGNLLSQLPVMSQQQKVEEFTFNTLKPPSPVTEAESTTSMVPMVSSNGTLTSRVASSGDDRPRTGASAIVEVPPATAKSMTREISTVDTDKMSIHELVTLGRKIYRILSQLSTHSPNKSVPPSPTFTINPYPQHSHRSFILNQTGSSMRGQSKSTTSAIVDFSIIPNPTFITGVGSANVHAAQSKSAPRVTDSGTNNKPPNLFRKFHQPPPTRWEKRSTSAHPTDIQQRRNPSEGSMARERNRRSASSVASKTPTRTPTRTILKWEVATSGHQSPKNSNSYTIKTYNETNTNNGNYNQVSQKSSRFIREEENASFSFPPAAFLEQPPLKTRGNSVGKRNFIQENISKIRRIKPTPKSRVPLLPPVSKKYENVPSVIASTSRARTDRSNSLPREESQKSQRDRSTSFQQRGQKEYLEITNTFRNNPPSRRASVPSNHSSRSQTPVTAKSRDSVKTKRQMRSKNTLFKGTINNNNNIEESRSGTSRIKIGGSQRSRSAFFTSKIATNMGGITSLSKTSVMRKSRSKTRRASAAYKQQMDQTKHSSVSSAERNQNGSQAKSKGKLTISKGGVKKKKGGRTTSQSHWASQRVAPLPEIQLRQSNDEEDELEVDGEKGEFVTSALSEQTVIRQMVKAEMDMMVERHVKDVLLRTKEEKNIDYRSARHKELMESEVEDSILDSENLEPVYTPPRFQDTSLFSLEQWINPEGHPGTAYTSSKDTPATTAEDGRIGSKKNSSRAPTKPQTVRFSLPQHK